MFSCELLEAIVIEVEEGAVLLVEVAVLEGTVKEAEGADGGNGEEGSGGVIAG